MCVFSSVQAKSKLNNAHVHSSFIVVHERECYNYVCVFSLVLAYVSGYIFVCRYIRTCMCMCSPRGAYLCHCQYVQAGSGGQLCVEGPGCSPGFSWELQWSMTSAENSRSKPPTG